MEARAQTSFVRISPRKVGLIADQVRGKPIGIALNYLRFSPRRRVAEIVSRLIKSAAANADQKGVADIDRFVVKTILVGKGPTLKRFKPRAKGSASRILKYTSHLKVVLSDEGKKVKK